jgi:hypothetical protein
MKRSAQITAVAVLLSSSGPALADEHRSVGLAYALSTAGVVVPTWSAIALMPREEGPLTASPRAVAAVSLAVASLTWGPSAGYFYSGNHRYAVGSGLGKTGLLGAGYLLHRTLDPADGHPYVMSLGVMAVALWGVGDFLFLARDVRRQNERRQASSPVMMSIGGHF